MFCNDLKDHAKRIINHKKKSIIPLTKDEEDSYKNTDITYRLKFIDSFRFMSTPLSKLVDNLTDGVHNDKCVNCKSNLCFVRTINGTLLFECVDCKKELKRNLIKYYWKDSRTHTNFVVMIWISFLFFYGKASTHMNIWMDGIGSVKRHYQTKIPSIVA